MGVKFRMISADNLFSFSLLSENLVAIKIKALQADWLCSECISISSKEYMELKFSYLRRRKICIFES